MHTARPKKVGNRKENAVHLKLAVSFFIVISVVEQGQCMSEKTVVQTAVLAVQSLAIRIFLISFKEPSSEILLFER